MEEKKLIKNYFYNNITDLLYINIYDMEGKAHLIIKSVNSEDKVKVILEKIETLEYFIYRDFYSFQVKLAMSKMMCEKQTRI